MSDEVPPVFGIYLGNTSCCISVCKNGNIDVVANAAGDRVTPALVSFQEKDVVVGTAAKQGLVRHERCTVSGVLRVIGSSKKDEITFPLNLNCQVNFDGKNPKISVQNEDSTKKISVADVLKHIFVLLKGIAGIHQSGDADVPVVVCLPWWAGRSAESEVRAAASGSGFDVLKIVSQPAAAALAYRILDDNTQRMNVAVFHCGGTSVVASVAEVNGGLLSVKETGFGHSSAGDSVTSVLVDHFAKEFFAKYKGDPLENRRSKRKLFLASENCKHVLSTVASAQVHVDSLWEGSDFSTQLSRARFEGLVSGQLNNILATLKDTVSRADLRQDQIHKVLLSGGSCKIPRLQRMITEEFPRASVLFRISPDEVLALGAVEEAAVCVAAKSKGKRSVPAGNSLISCLATPIFAKILGEGGSKCVFPAGTSSHSQQTLTLEASGPSASLVIFEAASTEDSTTAPEDHILAQVDLDFVDCSESVPIQLSSYLKGDGSLYVKVSEARSKAHRTFLIEAAES